MKKIVTVLKWTAVILAAAFSLLVIVRIPHVFEVRKTGDLVAKIHATKLTLDDVMGKNLPPDPGAEADRTVAGIDANRNGIRDDVELAIFKEYPNSAKTRAALLQYALALQMEMVQPIVNSDTVGAVTEAGDAAFFCVAKIVGGEDKQKSMEFIQKLESYITTKQFNTEARQNARKNFYDHLGSGSISSAACDIDVDSLGN